MPIDSPTLSILTQALRSGPGCAYGPHDPTKLEIEIVEAAHTFKVLCVECGARGPIGDSPEEAVKLFHHRIADDLIRKIEHFAGQHAIISERARQEAVDRAHELLTENVRFEERAKLAERRLREAGLADPQ